jgi:predicted DCC family thiol-disulfide oxidoreductase YuxK
MATLSNYQILFDAECPMCKVYTKAFVQTGLLEKDGRASYQDFDHATCPMVDMQRAVNEIALINLQTGEVTYGIQSLIKVFGTAVPLLKPLFAFAPFVWLMSKVYAFIAFNRRVIIPAAAGDTFQYQPTFKLHYRIAYLVFTWAVTSLILTKYVTLLAGLLPVGNAYREYMICGGQIFFQGLIITFVASDKRWSYLGNMMTISFAGSLLLLPVWLLSGLIGAQSLFYAGWFMLVAGLMFLEHIRRSKLLNLGWTLTITWALYRAAILLLIILLN